MGEDVVLLCYRGLKHYWPLVVRQLALPTGVQGESLPYRRDFVYDPGGDLLATAVNKKALICLKIDPEETVNGQSLYVPLRTGTILRVDPVPHGANLVHVVYEVGCTPDYRTPNSNCLAYSSMIRAAVSRVEGAPDAGNEALVIVVPLDFTPFTELGEEGESDRWIRLTRVLTEEGESFDGPAGPLLGQLRDDTLRNMYRDIYPRLLFIRWAGISKGDERIPWHDDAYKLRIDDQHEAEVFSSLLPRPEFSNRLFRWQLKGPTKHFDFFNWSVEMGPGIVRHRFPFEPRRASSRPMTLTLSPSTDRMLSDNEPHQFDVHLSVRPLYKPFTLALVIGAVISLVVGVVLATGLVDDDWVQNIGICEDWAKALEDGAPAVGVGLLIFGGLLGTFWQTTRRTE